MKGKRKSDRTPSIEKITYATAVLGLIKIVLEIIKTLLE